MKDESIWYNISLVQFIISKYSQVPNKLEGGEGVGGGDAY